MRRATRAAAKGVYYDNAIIAGLPCSAWVRLTEETYSVGMYGVMFNGWPDGKPLIEQEQCVVDIMKIVLVELAKELSSGP